VLRERELLGLRYSAVVQSAERELLGLRYSAVVQSAERELLGLTDCKCGGERVERGVFSVLCEVSEMGFGTIDCDDAHCYSG